MSILEDKIKKNRDQYDVHEPVMGHADRFADKLDAQFHKKSEIKPRAFMRYAAAIIIVTGIAAIMFFMFNGNGASVQANPMADELTMVSEHYNRLTDQKLQEITTCAASDEEAQKIDEMARTQLDNLEADAGELQEELAKDGSNQKVYGALVNNYRTRIKILDNILYQICNL